MLGDIDLTLTPEKVDLSLCRPDLTIISKLNEVYEVKHTIKLGDINELEFTVPAYINKNNIQIENPNISNIKDRYIVKLVKGLETSANIEYYIINTINTKADGDKDSKIVHCMALGYELRDKILRGYTATSYGATQILTYVLSETIWNVGYIDAEFDLTHRSFEFNSVTALDAVFQIAETFNAVIIWDTISRQIDFRQPDLTGHDKGLTIAYGKYLKDMDIETNPDEMCTRLKCYGADGLTFSGINPTGQAYIEDFTYFLYPFTRDVNNNALTHSDYMSDSLCNAILNYNDLIDLKATEFASLLAQKEALITGSGASAPTPIPVTPPVVDPTYYSVKDYGALGDNSTNDTVAINNLIIYLNSIGGGYVYIPDGTYMVDGVGTSGNGGIKPKSNVHLVLSTNAYLKVISNTSQYYQIVWFSNISNSSITGGNIVGDRHTHNYGTSGSHEWGYGIRITSGTNISCTNVNSTDCTGDGIVIGGNSTGQTYSQNVTITNCICDGNRRQGISVTSVVGLLVTGGSLINTNGTDPQAGIDFEPWKSSDYIQDCVVDGVTISGNTGWGIDWWFFHLVGGTRPVTIEIKNCIVTGNTLGNIRYASGFTSVNAYYDYLDIIVDGIQIGSG